MKTAVVTGASYGIGGATTEALLAEGWKVYGLSRSKPKFTNEQFVWLQCDLSQPEQLEKSLVKIEETKLDALVSNAGVVIVEKATEATIDSYNRTFAVNVLAPILLVRGLIERLKDKSIIVSVSSASDRFPASDLALYCSSKAANTLYFDSLARELSGSTKVYTLLPDFVDTPMLHEAEDEDTFDWTLPMKAPDVARFVCDLIAGRYSVESGANVLVVNEALKETYNYKEKLYGYNTDSKELVRLESTRKDVS